MKHIAIILMAGAALMTATSCSVANKVTGKSDTPTATVPALKIDKNKKKDKTPALEAPGTVKKMGTMPTADQLTGGQWTLVSVGDRQVNAEDEQPYICFDASGRFYASDGCNILNGDYTIRANGSMTFDHVLSTMKYCNIDYSAPIAAVIADNSHYAIDCRRIGQDTYLYFKNDSGKTVITYRRHNMEFLNGAWAITLADGKKIDDDEANIFIDVAELKVHGNTGCNYFNGDLYIDPARSNAIDFSNMGLTRMACPKSEQEQRIMVALEQAASAIAGKKENTVLILDAKGKEVMNLKRISNDNDN